MRTLALLLLLAAPAGAQLVDEDGFVRAGPGRPLRLPGDHGRHPETRTEWWYLTGLLDAADGRTFGFQATWFRRALVREVPPGRSPLATRDVMLFHGALTDVARGELLFDEASCRAWPPWAGAADGRLEVRLLEHALVARDADARSATLEYRAGGARVALDLDLAASRPLLHGAEPGLSVKGHEAGEASWYYSLPRIPVAGAVTLADGGTVDVTGRAWFDHEFGSTQLPLAHEGWDWFSVALDDGADLMLYRMRLNDGGKDSTSAATFRAPDGQTRHLGHDAFSVRALGEWTSPDTGVAYPSGWRLDVPSEGLRLAVTPLVRDQEILTPGSTGVTYWEGPCEFRGTRRGEPVAGRGYVELVGYDRRFRERL